MNLTKRNRESDLEAYLLQRVKALGGKTAKFSVDGENGHPDRLVKLPGAPAFLVELKRRGEVPTPLQRRRLAEWTAAGMYADWADTERQVDLVLLTAKDDAL